MSNDSWNMLSGVSVPVKIVLPIVSAIIGAAFYTGNHLKGYENEIKDLRDDVIGFNDNRFDLTMKSEDALRTALLNPGLKVPDPRNPGQYFLVEGAAIAPVTP